MKMSLKLLLTAGSKSLMQRKHVEPRRQGKQSLLEGQETENPVNCVRTTQTVNKIAGDVLRVPSKAVLEKDSLMVKGRKVFKRGS